MSPVPAADPYDRAACGLLRCAADGTVLRSNVTLRQWLGYPPDHRFVSLYDVLSPPSLLFFEMQLRPLLALGRTVDGAFVMLRRSDGSVLPVVVNAVQHAYEPSIEFAMLVVREREQYEETLREAQFTAEQALHAMAATAHAQKMQAVGQMAAGIAHEFNNQLAVVRGNLEFASSNLDQTMLSGAGVLEDLRQASDATDRMEGIVRQLLAFTGRQIMAVGSLDLNAVVQAAAQLVTHALGRDTVWRTHLAPDLWRILAASDQMEQLVTNLVLNANEAVAASGRAGQITVATHNVPADATTPIDRVRLSVSDTGVGMSDDVRLRAVDPFFSTKGLANGVGLGLSMAYGAVRAMRGELEINSTPGEGANVTITLPRARA